MREDTTPSPTFAQLFPWKGRGHKVPAIIGPKVPVREVQKVAKAGPVTIVHWLCTPMATTPYILTVLALCLAWIGSQLMELEQLAHITGTLSISIACIFITSQLTSWLLAHRERHFLEHWAPQIMVGHSPYQGLLVIAKKELTGQPIEELVDPEKRLASMAASFTNKKSASNEDVSQLLNLALEYRETRNPEALKQAQPLYAAARIMDKQRTLSDDDPH